MTARGKKRVIRHRSPLPPPSRLMDKPGYRRSAEKERVRRDRKGEGR